MRRYFRTALLSLFNLLMLVGAGCQVGATEVVKPESNTPWAFTTPAPFAEKEAKENLSGIACPVGGFGANMCLVLADEGVEAAFIRLENNRLAYENTTIAFPGVYKEFDAEAAATDGTFYYVAGSHSVKRKSCKDHPANRNVFRIKIDQSIGGASSAAEPIKPEDRLWTIMKGLPDLAAYVGDGKCLGTLPPPNKPDLLGQNGVNIEGLAVMDGRLYFGFRGPAILATALILSVKADALFSGGGADPKLTKISVGDKRAIRDLLAVDGRLLALVGADDDDTPVGSSIVAVDGLAGDESAVSVRELAMLDLSGAPLDQKGNRIELKPEAMTLLASDAGHYRLLVLSDGGADGAPLVFNIPR